MENTTSQIKEIISKKDQLKFKQKECSSLDSKLSTQERSEHSLDRELWLKKSENKGGFYFITVMVILVYILISSFLISVISENPEDTNILVSILIILGLIPGFFILIVYLHINDVRKIEKNIISQTRNINKIKNEIKIIKPEIKTLENEISLLEESYSFTLKESFHEMFDKNKNIEIDELEKTDDFILLIQTNQQKIIEFDKSENKDYIKLFVQVHERIELKKNNINKLFNEILKYKGPYDKDTNKECFIQIIKNEIHSYNVLLMNSIFMVSSLINDDRITFYKIYQSFDKLNIFNSHFENESLNHLKNINKNLIEVIDRIEEMNFSITSELQELKYINDENTELIQESLNQINSSINFNTLINSINTYQNYKINKNTKRLN